MRWLAENNRVEFGDVEEDTYSGEYVDCHSNADSELLARMVAVALNDAEVVVRLTRWAQRRLEEYEGYTPDYTMRFEDGYIQCLTDVLEMIKELTSESTG